MSFWQLLIQNLTREESHYFSSNDVSPRSSLKNYNRLKTCGPYLHPSVRPYITSKCKFVNLRLQMSVMSRKVFQLLTTESKKKITINLILWHCIYLPAATITHLEIKWQYNVNKFAKINRYIEYVSSKDRLAIQYSCKTKLFKFCRQISPIT